jgi:hypothetical protein
MPQPPHGPRTLFRRCFRVASGEALRRFARLLRQGDAASVRTWG